MILKKFERIEKCEKYKSKTEAAANERSRFCLLKTDKEIKWMMS